MAKRAVDSLWFPEKLGLRLAELRRQQGLTQGQVAELMGKKEGHFPYYQHLSMRGGSLQSPDWGLSRATGGARTSSSSPAVW